LTPCKKVTLWMGGGGDSSVSPVGILLP
jgi:hypothetical protein